MRLSELFQGESDSFVSEKPINHLAGRFSSLELTEGVVSPQSNESRIDFSRMTRQESVIETFRKQVKQSLNLINAPKSAIYSQMQVPGSAKSGFYQIHHEGANSYEQTQSQSYLPHRFVKPQQQTSENQRQQSSSRAISNIHSANRINLPAPASQASSRMLLLSREKRAIDSAKQILKNRKIDSAAWAELKEGMEEQIALKEQVSRSSISNKNKSQYQISRQITPFQNKNNSAINNDSTQAYPKYYYYNNNYTNTEGQDRTTQFDKTNTQFDKTQTQFDKTQTQFDKSHSKFSIQQRSAASSKSKQITIDQRLRTLNDQLYTQKLQKSNIAHSYTDIRSMKTETTSINIQQFHHKMISSICMAQIKPIKGGCVKKVEKEKFQQYYDSVSERLRDIRQTRTQNDFDLAQKHILDWKKIKYQPANQDQECSMQELKQLYQREKNIEVQQEIEMLLSSKIGDYKQNKTSQPKDEKIAEEYKKKTFFLVRDYVKEQGDKQQESQLQQSEQNPRVEEKKKEVYILKQKKREMEMEELMKGLEVNKEVKEIPKVKYTRIAKKLCEFLQKLLLLGITIQESCNENIQLRKPFKRKLGEQFFSVIKQNNGEEVLALLEQDKYLVYDLDCVLLLTNYLSKLILFHLLDSLISSSLGSQKRIHGNCRNFNCLQN